MSFCFFENIKKIKRFFKISGFEKATFIIEKE
jgi:hypothetical protein